MIAFAVSEAALGYVPKENKFKKVIKKIIDWVRHKLFGPTWTANVYAKTMDENTSVSDIAKLLANSNRRFTLERVDRKLVGSQYDFAVDSKPKFIAHTEKKIELSDANEKDRAWLDRFYGSIWDDAGRVGYTKKEDFASIMIPLLGDELFGSFSTWYRRKFKSKKVPNVSDEFTGKDSLYDIAKVHVDKNDDLLRKIRDNGMGSDEKALPTAKLFYLKAFGITLHKSELNTLIKLAKNLDRSGKGYNEWKNMIFKKGEPLYGQKKDMAKWQERGLKRYHAQLLSTSKVNRGDALQEITNYEMLMNRVIENGNVNYKFNFRKKGPEKTYRERAWNWKENKYIYNEKKANVGFQKKTLFDNILENSGLFGWLSGSDIKTIKYHKDDAKQLIMDEQGQFLSDFKSLY